MEGKGRHWKGKRRKANEEDRQGTVRKLGELLWKEREA